MINDQNLKRLVMMLRDDALDFHSMVSNELNLHPENDERTSLDLLQSLRISLMAISFNFTNTFISARDNISQKF